MSKPKVKCRLLSEHINLNCRAIIEPLDHPSPLVSNTGPAQTTPLMCIHYVDGKAQSFETANTIYEIEEEA
jgi:hypothetical protein